MIRTSSTTSSTSNSSSTGGINSSNPLEMANSKVNNPDVKMPGETGLSHKKIIAQKLFKYHGADNGESLDKIKKWMHSKITHDYSDLAPHINGYYYIQMIHGTWADTVSQRTGKVTATQQNGVDSFAKDYNKANDMSSFGLEHFNRVSNEFGQLATDIDIPQLNIEYESVSGKARNLSYASRLHYAGDFSINFIENYTNDIFRYHESWFKYIDALKKGYVTLMPNSDDNRDTDYFIDIPYFNAVWVVIFAPLSTNIRGLIKIMGVSPINLPFKQIIGDRSKSTMTTINQSYKSNDMIYKFYDDETEYADSPFFQEFQADMSKIYANGAN